MCVGQKGRKDIAVSLSPEVYSDATAIAHRYDDSIHHHILFDDSGNLPELWSQPESAR